MPGPPRTIIDRLRFAEGPRWYDGALWFSDMFDHRVVRWTLAGDWRTVVDVPYDVPSGLGWLPDGRMLIVGMNDRQLLCLESDGSLAVHAELSGVARGTVNDMIVAGDGTAYVGDLGFRAHHEPLGQPPGQLIKVTSSGEVSIAADQLLAPNGMILSDDERTLIVAETAGRRLTAFDRADDGSLSNRRVFAELSPRDGLPTAVPDGICYDAEGAVWVAEAFGQRLIRMLPGGVITDTVQYEGASPIACVIGGPDRRTLFACVAVNWTAGYLINYRDGRVDAIEIAVPGAGKP